jgi:hypothetical protein
VSLFGKTYCPVCGMRVLALSGKCIYAGNDDHFDIVHGRARPIFCEVCGQRLGVPTGKCVNEDDSRHRAAAGSSATAP